MSIVRADVPEPKRAVAAAHQPGQDVFKSLLSEDIEWKLFAAFPPSVRLAVVVDSAKRNEFTFSVCCGHHLPCTSDDITYKRCRCPKWVNGLLGSNCQFIRPSAKTRSWERQKGSNESWNLGKRPNKTGSREPTAITCGLGTEVRYFLILAIS